MMNRVIVIIAIVLLGAPLSVQADRLSSECAEIEVQVTTSRSTYHSSTRTHQQVSTTNVLQIYSSGRYRLHTASTRYTMGESDPAPVGRGHTTDQTGRLPRMRSILRRARDVRQFIRQEQGGSGAGSDAPFVSVRIRNCIGAARDAHAAVARTERAADRVRRFMRESIAEGSARR